ncbi:Oxo-4-hydroxy-4-carboxy-5-ureidoimidazoline decarboxylase [Mariannaea sp. PMI_226]|nr:Oxo-4-hydroxy-4-carboxy-5-ureidoimidazoline decarboxylase [Mariannaea sp. PMI_226]
MYLPKAASLHSLTEPEQTQALDLLFEPSPAIHDTLLPIVRDAEYKSYSELIDACHNRFLSLAATSATSASTTANLTDGSSTQLKSTPKPDPTLLSILGSHPRLGAKKVESVQSAAEQANLQGEGEVLARLNEEYEAKFPGLRYVVFVNGRGRPEIMENMRMRMTRGDYAQEVNAAIEAMCDIAKDRAGKIQGAATRKRTNEARGREGN